MLSLIIDSDANSAKLASILLKAAGFTSMITHSAEDARRVLGQFRPDVIVTELVPVMRGTLLVETLKAAPATKNVPIVIVTAFNGPEAERVARLAGASSYLRKPISVDTFADQILAAIGAKS